VSGLSDERFPQCHRLRHRREFQAVYDRRNLAAGTLLVVYGRPNGLLFNRLGLSVSRRLGGAVVRNRFKRQCREAFRRSRAEQPIGWDWIVAAAGTGGKAKANSAVSHRPVHSFAAVLSEFIALTRRVARNEKRRQRRGDPKAKPS
jgi:ribonuclease P protein component